VEETPDPHGTFWLTADKAKGILAYVENKPQASSDFFRQVLRKVSESSESEATPE
jgi:hypothetical protein